ncbi:hypothetical protein [Microlunatus ginsengisoli]|uniref:Galactose mutarotase n=1 Tax=Microlunatus ginsengisoli TaxID=363863 RepID=A0ABP6ZSC4_9ACTN
MTDGWTGVPLTLRTDPDHGGRWTSLRTADREWLWTNPDPAVAGARLGVAPGAPFVDAGGAEECFPTVRGKPDHGDAWTRRWQSAGATDCVRVEGSGTLTRRATPADDALRLDYTIEGTPGTRFLHAVHVLLEVGPRARLEVPGTQVAVVLDPAPVRQPWPAGGLDRLGPDDGTAVCVLLPGCRTATVIDGDHALRLEWDAPAQPDSCSLLLWRNLRGWPSGRPYRSIGVEPMVGRAADLAAAGPDDAARLDVPGRFGWTLRLTALRRTAAHSSIHAREEALR